MKVKLFVLVLMSIFMSCDSFRHLSVEQGGLRKEIHVDCGRAYVSAFLSHLSRLEVTCGIKANTMVTLNPNGLKLLYNNHFLPNAVYYNWKEITQPIVVSEESEIKIVSQFFRFEVGDTIRVDMTEFITCDGTANSENKINLIIP